MPVNRQQNRHETGTRKLGREGMLSVLYHLPRAPLRVPPAKQLAEQPRALDSSCRVYIGSLLHGVHVVNREWSLTKHDEKRS